ncbi:PHD finger protein ALFIN-LIKE 4-like [Impatiens glandulifera]|uniref:PHD finger protein ALFIN-LIKE 4-like n=1 Tax=Impatiens glandulifera TaxID=253017 RepID=UPI001FB14EE9|nr:PHD finger protein ALFIN-LIKE 4-like [Impatiens glandulifera]XP_047340685.1 PHD finger protein ALFIN-LIKE 4-like [Impatiens glandulifera]XP_047340686.1 PHD finger protein ALFIN-LIKE 4-like [Impatiens glandulifera]XP_047340687.1 PHD finger protein ALFIN-LIKE 4-like [Impatiens glandulifera]XP_047340688.1 PHD finger protein ALFIN-LIKE 4-like [Impatiens glandulifera]XP_047340689.1 PHD finger protein ALFIN-LIKE 4-like [Impatiens glandulifera]
MVGPAQYNLRNMEEIFLEFKGRRAGILKALTTDFDQFYELCDPEKENMCLYGYPNEQWEAAVPFQEVPPEYPEPSIGINFSRDGMQKKHWLALVAAHSDAWLISVSFYLSARYAFKKSDRMRLFKMMNDLPTVFEVVTGSSKKQQQTEKSLVNNRNSNKSSSKMGIVTEDHGQKSALESKVEDEDDLEVEIEDDEDEDETLCGACGKNYSSDEFWICCDICETWFHGKCVKITPTKAEHMKQYKCPACSNKRPRP